MDYFKHLIAGVLSCIAAAIEIPGALESASKTQVPFSSFKPYGILSFSLKVADKVECNLLVTGKPNPQGLLMVFSFVPYGLVNFYFLT